MIHPPPLAAGGDAHEHPEPEPAAGGAGVGPAEPEPGPAPEAALAQWVTWSVLLQRHSEDLLDRTPLPCLLTDPGGRIRKANPAAAAFLGPQARELPGTLLAELLPATARAAFAAQLARATGCELPTSLVLPIGGAGQGVSWTVRAIGRGDEPPCELLWLAAPAAQTALDGGNAAAPGAADVLESMADALCALDGEWRFLYLNRQAERWFGISHGQLLGREIWNALPAAAVPAVREELDRARRERRPGRTELRDEPRDAWMELQAYPVGPVLWIAIRDVTERRCTEERERAFARVIEEARSEIYMFDAQTLRFERVNRGARENLGYTAEELRALTPLDVKPEFTEESFRALLEPLRGGEEMIRFETMHRRKDGSHYPVDVHLQSAVVGERPVYLALMVDTTERRRAEERERSLIREHAAREAAEALARRAQLLAEIGQTLASSLDYSETLQRVAEMLVPRLADWCVIDLLGDSGELELVKVHATETRKQALLHWMLQRHPHPGSPDPHPVGEVIRSGESRLLAEITGETLARVARDEDHLRMLRELDPASSMVVPLRVKGATVGVITLSTSHSGRHYGPEDLAFAEELARRAAMAIENARLYRRTWEARKEAERLADRTARLQRITAAPAEALSPPAVAERILHEAVEALGASVGAIAILAPGGSELEVLHQIGPPGEEHPPGHRFPADAALPMAQAVRSGTPVFVHTAEALRARYPSLASSGAAAWAAVPLAQQGAVVGAFGLAFAEPQGFAEEERGFLHAIANQCARALERARLFAEEHRARTEAERASRARDEVLGIVAHDLRNPLGGIRMFASSILQRSPADDERRGALEGILRATYRMDRLIQDLLDVSRVEAGKLRIEAEPLSVPPLLAEVEELLGPAAQAAGLEIRTEAAAGLPRVCADRERVLQVLSNLVDNAIRYTPKGGAVVLRAAHAGGFVRLSVADPGVGIPAEELPFLFDRYWQASQRRRGGAGLGLAIAKGIVEAHGGEITAESEPGRGTTLTFTLPVAKAGTAGAAAPAAEPVQRPPRTVPSPLPERLRVLLVDDHPMIRRGLAELLRRDPRFEVVGEAGTGEEAVALAHELSAEIVLMDLAMPGMSGLEAMRWITERDAEVRVLAITSDTEEESLLAVLDAGGSGFVRKTAVHEDLAEALQTVARGEVFLYSSAAKVLLRGYRDAEHRRGERFESLTEQEREVLRLVAEGYTSREIGKRLFLSSHTVDSYRSQVMKKLGLSHRSELVKFALRTGLLARR